MQLYKTALKNVIFKIAAVRLADLRKELQGLVLFGGKFQRNIHGAPVNKGCNYRNNSYQTPPALVINTYSTND
jgi:hypothetical protein